MIVHRVTARNTAASSPNKIHDETVARSYGFAGGLVPGVTVFAWMCGPALESFGRAWLEGGAVAARFVRPIYEADEVLVEGSPAGDAMTLTVRAAEEVRATGSASIAPAASLPDVPPRAPLPEPPPPASPATMSPGATLGTIDATYEHGPARAYLASIGADHPLTAGEGVAHPGWLLLLANLALSSNVSLGPWIHVASDMRMLGLVKDGAPVEARSRVADVYEGKGHRFVELDVIVLAESNRPVAAVRHTAIYEPRAPAS